MSSSSTSRQRQPAYCALAVALAVVASLSSAGSQVVAAGTRIEVDLRPTLDAFIVDNSPFDGLPDGLDANLAAVQLNSGFDDSRTVIEFDLNALPQGARIRRAQLRLTINGKTVAAAATSLPIEVRAFRSNGVLDLGDFHRGQFEGVFDALPIPIDATAKVDVTPTVSAIYENSSRRLVGFVLRTTGLGGIGIGSQEFGKPAVLRIVYTTQSSLSGG